MNLVYKNVPDAFASLNALLASHGATVDGYLEIFNANITIDSPRERIATFRGDDSCFVPYMALQWAWYATTNQDTKLKEYYPQGWERAKDGDVNSNYGQYVWKERQFMHCLKLLRENPNTRRAVMMFNRRDVSMSDTNDHICTTSLQLLARGGKLHLITTMRSNELHFGFRTDVVFFTMIQEIMAKILGLDVGTYYHNVGSLHVKKEHITDKHITLIDLPEFHPMELGDILLLRKFFDPDQELEPSIFELTSLLQQYLKFFKT